MCASGAVLAQKPNKFEDAQQRSQDAARIISLFGVSAESDLPKELVDRAYAIGVFPKVVKASVVFSSLTEGYGVISARTETGWTMPAYYHFTGGGFGNPFAKAEINSVMLLFMTKESLGWFEKGGVDLKDEKKAIEGPTGPLNDAQRKEVEGAGVIAYAYYNGKLSGKAFGKSFWQKFNLDPDNNINTPLYNLKGREVLAGNPIAETPARPATIATFTDALQKYYSAPKTSAN